LEQEKLVKFRQAVFSDVDAKIDAIKKEAEELKLSSREQTENEELDDAYLYIQANSAKIKAEYSLIVSKAELAAKQNVLLQRENYRQMILDRVRERLTEYASTQEYKDGILLTFSSLVERYSLDQAVVCFGEKDAWIKDELTARYPEKGFRFETSAFITLGGFNVRDEKKGFVIDETLDTKLQEQIPYFNQNCRLAAE